MLSITDIHELDNAARSKFQRSQLTNGSVICEVESNSNSYELIGSPSLNKMRFIIHLKSPLIYNLFHLGWHTFFGLTDLWILKIHKTALFPLSFFSYVSLPGVSLLRDCHYIVYGVFRCSYILLIFTILSSGIRLMCSFHAVLFIISSQWCCRFYIISWSPCLFLGQ